MMNTLSIRRSIKIAGFFTIASLPMLLVPFAAAAPNKTDLESFRTTVTLPEVSLLDQNQQPQSLQTLAEEKVVVVDFVFTSCRSICPIITAVMKRVHGLLKTRLGDSIVLVSVTLDPAHDTPEVLQHYASKWGNVPNWLWLSGSSREVAAVLKAFTINPNDAPESHPPLLFVGKGQQWFKWVGLPDPKTVAQVAIDLADAS